jgi:hypothetical protein
MNIIDKINFELEKHFNSNIPRLYENDRNPFFDEGDLVSSVNKRLMEFHDIEGCKIFREYPVDLIAPLRMTNKTYNDLLSLQYPVEKYYEKEAKSGYHDLFCNIDKIIADAPFANIEKVNKEGKFARQYEPKYFDLVVFDNYNTGNIDELIRPKIVLEFKYEAATYRRGEDLRHNITLPKNNPQSVKHDIDAIKLYCTTNPGTIGYFIFVDEEEGCKNIMQFKVESLLEGVRPIIKLPCNGGILMHIFQYDMK